MRSVSVVSLIGLMMIFFTTSSLAMEHRLGGNWSTMALTMRNFTGEDQTKAMNLSQAETIVGIVYTTQISENLKFVNRFEFSSVWGDEDSFGRIGADGLDLCITNSYADFDLGLVNFRLGVQDWGVARGFIFDDDFAGAVVTYKGDGFELPFAWIKGREGGIGKDQSDDDLDYYAISPVFEIGDTASINPYLLYITSSHAGESNFDTEEKDGLDVYYLGADFDLETDSCALWLTGIWLAGKIDRNEDDDQDISAGLAAIGGSVALGDAEIHGEFFYATGQNDEDADMKAFIGPEGNGYAWAEIMGEGQLDIEVSANSPGPKITNIMAANIGASLDVAEEISVGLDLWYAKFAEKVEGEYYLGTEIDATVTYELLEGLELDIIVAYLFAGDATYKGAHQANPFEIGTILSFAF